MVCALWRRWAWQKRVVRCPIRVNEAAEVVGKHTVELWRGRWWRVVGGVLAAVGHHDARVEEAEHVPVGDLEFGDGGRLLQLRLHFEDPDQLVEMGLRG